MKTVLIEMPETIRTPEEDYPNSYVAIPPNGKVCQVTGLKHSLLYKLLTRGGSARDFVRVVNLKCPGTKKGKTLFHVGDMLQFLDAMALKQGSGMRDKVGLHGCTKPQK